MKTNYLKASLFALAAMVACTEYEQIDEPQGSTDNGPLQELSITGKDFQFDDATRSSVTIGENGASFTWDEEDVIGIFPDKGDQVSFAMDEGAGTQTATFSGGGWALKSSAKYAAYYPHVYENRDLTAIPVSYLDQTQNGNANTEHIGAYDFMAAGVSTPENGAVAFDMQHLGALVQLTLTIPEPSTLKKVALSSATEFTETGTIDLTAENPTISTKSQSNTLEIVLKDVNTTEPNENVIVYFMTAPVDFTHSELTVTVHCIDDTIIEGKITGKNLQAGKAYRLSADKLSNETDEPEGSIPNNQIWYTATTKVEPFFDDVFGANIISNTFQNGKGIITFMDEVTKLGESAFYSCELTSVTLHNSVTIIDKEAFAWCSRLTRVNVPDGVTTIGESAFFNCSCLTNVTIPNSVTTIGDCAFEGCNSITSITIPNSVTKLGNTPFKACLNLKEFKGKFAADNGRCLIKDDTIIAYANASGDTYSIPDGITRIIREVFYQCDLTDVTIPDSVTEIERYAFYWCQKLKSVNIGNGITTIGESAFYGCHNLKEFKGKFAADNGRCLINGNTIVAYAEGSGNEYIIPNNVTSIGDYAFYWCNNLESVTIPDSVTKIGQSAFNSCYKLKYVYCESSTPPSIGLYGGEFSNNASGRKFYVPQGSVDDYIDSWSYYASSIVGYEF